jgi:hypothetical protein
MKDVQCSLFSYFEYNVLWIISISTTSLDRGEKNPIKINYEH